MAAAKKPKGLVLTLGGAPNTPHFIPGVSGLFRPDIPTPVGLAVSEAEAKKLDSDPSMPLALVDIDDLEAATEAYEQAVSGSVSVQRKLRRSKTKGAEEAHINDEIDATKGA